MAKAYQTGNSGSAGSAVPAQQNSDNTRTDDRGNGTTSTGASNTTPTTSNTTTTTTPSTTTSTATTATDGVNINGGTTTTGDTTTTPTTTTTTYYDDGSSSSSSSKTKKTPEDTGETQATNILDVDAAAQTTEGIVSALDDAGLTTDQIEAAKVNHIDTTELENNLKEQTEAAKQQQTNAIDYATNTSINEQQRAEEDAATDYQTERDQIAADEQKALDNQALYAQARGDNGGIGAAQYAEIQNNAATNQMTVNNAQIKLSTDTARQIQDLRAQGEFEKADALLDLTQSYLSQLQTLQQWGIETNLSVDEFNSQIDQWAAEYNEAVKEAQINTELEAAQLTGAFSNGTTTFSAQEQIREALAAAGEEMLDLKLTPTTEQLAAMGMTEAEYTEWRKKHG